VIDGATPFIGTYVVARDTVAITVEGPGVPLEVDVHAGINARGTEAQAVVPVGGVNEDGVGVDVAGPGKPPRRVECVAITRLPGSST